MLVFGEREAYGSELGQPGGAAILLAAAPHPAEPLGFVTRADLAQLDPGVQRLGEVAHQLAKINPLLGGEIDGELLPVPLPFRVAHLHVEVAGAHPLMDRAAGIPLGAPELVGGPHVVRGGAPDHRVRRRFHLAYRAALAAAALPGRGVAGCGNPAEVEPALHRHDHGFPQPEWLRLVGPQEVILPVALETDFYRRGHQASVKTPIPAYFSARRRTSFSGRNFRSSPTWRMSASRSASPAASGS